MMRLEPHHLERGEEVEMDMQTFTSRTPTKSYWLLSQNGIWIGEKKKKKHDSEFTVSYDIEKSYVAFLELQKRKKICH